MFDTGKSDAVCLLVFVLVGYLQKDANVGMFFELRF